MLFSNILVWRVELVDQEEGTWISVGLELAYFRLNRDQNN